MTFIDRGAYNKIKSTYNANELNDTRRDMLDPIEQIPSGEHP